MSTVGGWRGLARQAGRLALLVIPKAGGGVFLIALNLVLVRVLAADDYGRFAYCMTLVLLADAVIGAPFDLAVIKLSGEGGAAMPMAAARAALHAKLALIAGLTVFAALMAVVVAPSAVQFELVAATSLAIVSMLVVRSVQVTLQVAGRFRDYAIVESLQLVLRVALVATVIALLPASAALMLAAIGAGGLAASLVAGLGLQRDLFSLGNRRGLPYPVLATSAGWYLGTTALGALIGRLDILTLGWLATPADIGLYTAGQVIASVAELAGSYLAIFLTPMLVASLRKGTTAALFRRMQPPLLALAFCGLVAAHFIWPIIGPMILPAPYQRSGEVALILMTGTFAAFATVPLALPLLLFRHRSALLAMDVVLFPIIALGYVLAIRADGEIGAAYVTAATMLLRSLLVQLAVSWSLLRQPPSQHE